MLTKFWKYFFRILFLLLYFWKGFDLSIADAKRFLDRSDLASEVLEVILSEWFVATFRGLLLEQPNLTFASCLLLASAAASDPSGHWLGRAGWFLVCKLVAFAQAPPPEAEAEAARAAKGDCFRDQS